MCLENYLCAAPNSVVMGVSYYKYKWHELKYLVVCMTSKNVTNVADRNTTKLELKIFQMHIGFMQSSGCWNVSNCLLNSLPLSLTCKMSDLYFPTFFLS